ncbi:dihydrofolate reductase family protein [Actinomadura kijaniata]|uniref:Dihydrofolate reductase n=1 Tax=Actinomadura namibiensis TaxID=182080 RepID=A0A7W3LJI4_ACTNM|nr:dihydrofolate reductase family protein [Actinomadura namibiensis]MBA8949308.1 dihydrofolate reductase [Actinomadura namibiensis]
MGKVYTAATVSLDGFIAGPDESGFDRLFRWYGNGDVEVPSANPDVQFRLTKENAGVFVPMIENTGALVVGRRLFDLTGGWGGRHPMDRHVVVLTHSVPEGWPEKGENFTFVGDGIESAVATAREIAGGRDVGVNGGTIASQCLEARLLDEIWVALAPVLLGAGRPYFDELRSAPLDLEGPLTVLDAKDVTHLRYRVRYP